MLAPVGVRRPLPQKPGSDRRSGAIPVGAALAAIRQRQIAGFDADQEKARPADAEAGFVIPAGDFR